MRRGILVISLVNEQFFWVKSRYHLKKEEWEMTHVKPKEDSRQEL